ncbi:hypothetical protein COV11_03000 [Candidatus Woesearchaeota archaeon CG10_big_fil_rev_8_21_14_0_10_30_7]|nr:MAG: hypothetical protein COV11_03000 [Candidatus Woesearchaeota archaeon CG10_big_fil_rev_8_21_14_0_10_30_7]
MSEALANRELAEKVYYQLSLIYQIVNRYDHNNLTENEMISVTSISKNSTKDIINLLNQYKKPQLIKSAQTKEKEETVKYVSREKTFVGTKRTPLSTAEYLVAADKAFIQALTKSVVENLIVFNAELAENIYRTQGGILKALSELVIIPFIKTLMRFKQPATATKTAALTY